MPTALLIAPDRRRPASVTPRCSGYGTRAGEHPVGADHRRHVARLDRDLEVAVVEPLEQPHLLERRLDERLGLVFLGELSRCFGSEPELAPIRIGMPAFFAALTTCSTLSGPPMLPGLIRTAATPASIAFRARLALKWMSAITGIGEKRTICGSASASSSFGTATRTTSQPALASAAICAVVAGHVVRLRQRHRLDDDRCAAADRDAAYAVTRALATVHQRRSRSQCLAPAGTRSFRRPR